MGLCLEAGHVVLGGREILRGVDLHLCPGELVGIVGPNGAGKSTLLRVLAGLLPPARGHVVLDALALARLPPRARARRVAYLPQGVEPISGFSAEEVVWMGRYPHRGRLGGGDAAGPDAVARALARVDAAPLAREPFSRLSGGEQQRVRIARTLATDAPALLLDEPAAGLDPRHVLDLLAVLRAEAACGRVVALTLHDLDLAHRHCDRLVMLAAGRVAADGPARCVLGPELVQRVFGVRPVPLEDGGRRALLLERLERPPPPKGGRSPRPCGPK